MARETMAEIRAGRPVRLFLTDFPRILVNHSVSAFDYHVIGAETVDFVARRALPLRSTLGVTVPYFRAFRRYYSPIF